MQCYFRPYTGCLIINGKQNNCEFGPSKYVYISPLDDIKRGTEC